MNERAIDRALEGLFQQALSLPDMQTEQWLRRFQARQQADPSDWSAFAAFMIRLHTRLQPPLAPYRQALTAALQAQERGQLRMATLLRCILTPVPSP